MSWLVSRCQSCHDAAWLLIRLMLAAVFMFHGAQKLFGSFDGPGMTGWTQGLTQMQVPMPAVAAWVSALTEFGGGLLVGIGLLTRLVTIPMIINMAVAIIMVHPGAFSTEHGGMEFPLTLAVMLTALLIAGPGRWSVDGLISGECCRPGTSHQPTPAAAASPRPPE